jgi:hypothetical protein
MPVSNTFTLQQFKSKRWTFTLMGWLLFIVAVHLYFKGLFMTKKELTNKSTMFWQNDTFWLESKFFKRNQSKLKKDT